MAQTLMGVAIDVAKRAAPFIPIFLGVHDYFATISFVSGRSMQPVHLIAKALPRVIPSSSTNGLRAGAQFATAHVHTRAAKASRRHIQRLHTSGSLERRSLRRCEHASDQSVLQPPLTHHGMGWHAGASMSEAT